MRASSKQLELSETLKKGVQCPATIGFRVDEEDGTLLAARAKTLGVSVHELARHYVLILLRDQDERGEVRDAILRLQRELVELRKDVVISSEALLSSAGKISPEDARAWVDKNLSAG